MTTDPDIRAAVANIKELAASEPEPFGMYSVADADDIDAILAAVASGELVPRAEIERGLSDPTAVHYSMVKGTIAKPSVAQICHVYAGDLVPRADVDGLVGAAKVAVLSLTAVGSSRQDEAARHLLAALTAWENRNG